MQMVALELFSMFNCFPVFLGPDLKERYYRGTCPFFACWLHMLEIHKACMTLSGH